METLIIINFILTIALCVVVFLHVRHYRLFARRVAIFAQTIGGATPLKKGLLVGFAAIALLTVIRKIFGGSSDVASK